MLRCLALVLALLPFLLIASEKPSAQNCCELDDTSLSQKQMTDLLDKTEKIQPPCCGHGLHIEGIIVSAISVDTKGHVTCVTVVSGHPLITGVTIDSIRQWKFRPYAVKRVKRNFCGKVSIHYEATEYGVKYEVIQGKAIEDTQR